MQSKILLSLILIACSAPPRAAEIGEVAYYGLGTKTCSDAVRAMQDSDKDGEKLFANYVLGTVTGINIERGIFGKQEYIGMDVSGQTIMEMFKDQCRNNPKRIVAFAIRETYLQIIRGQSTRK